MQTLDDWHRSEENCKIGHKPGYRSPNLDGTLIAAMTRNCGVPELLKRDTVEGRNKNADGPPLSRVNGSSRSQVGSKKRTGVYQSKTSFDNLARGQRITTIFSNTCLAEASY